MTGVRFPARGDIILISQSKSAVGPTNFCLLFNSEFVRLVCVYFECVSQDRRRQVLCHRQGCDDKTSARNENFVWKYYTEGDLLGRSGHAAVAET